MNQSLNLNQSKDIPTIYIRENKDCLASRVPPGDRWALLEDESDIVFGSLTDCLNQIYVVHQATQFFIDAKKGEVYIEDGVEKPQPVKKYSLYGEEI